MVHVFIHLIIPHVWVIVDHNAIYALIVQLLLFLIGKCAYAKQPNSLNAYCLVFSRAMPQMGFSSRMLGQSFLDISRIYNCLYQNTFNNLVAFNMHLPPRQSHVLPLCDSILLQSVGDSLLWLDSLMSKRLLISLEAYSLVLSHINHCNGLLDCSKRDLNGLKSSEAVDLFLIFNLLFQKTNKPLSR
jgi:hypothetical protein